MARRIRIALSPDESLDVEADQIACSGKGGEKTTLYRTTSNTWIITRSFNGRTDFVVFFRRVTKRMLNLIKDCPTLCAKAVEIEGGRR